MSLWSDIQDRCSGEMTRKEDMQKTINDLTEEVKRLQEVNKKLLEELDGLKRYNDFFHKQPVWYGDWNYENEDKGRVEHIFKF